MTNLNETTNLITTPSTSETIISTQTPIEVALQIDNDGMTTASNLYEFLELNPAHFSRWCKRNIINNVHTTEGIDYIVIPTHSKNNFRPVGENPKGGRPKTDYKLTAELAKTLCMTGQSLRHSQARSYFLACEKGLRIATLKMQEHNSSIDTAQLSQAIANSISSALSPISERLSALDSKVSMLEENVEKIKTQPAKPRYNSFSAR